MVWNWADFFYGLAHPHWPFVLLGLLAGLWWQLFRWWCRLDRVTAYGAESGATGAAGGKSRNEPALHGSSGHAKAEPEKG